MYFNRAQRVKGNPSALHRPTHQRTVALARQRSQVSWSMLAAMWVVYYVAVLTIGRYPEYQKSILWLGGAIVTVLTLVPMLRNGERLPAEAWLLFTFLLWSVAGFYMIEDTRGFLQKSTCILNHVKAGH